MRKVCVVLVDRANLGRLKTVIEAIQAHPALELQIVCGGTMPLNRFKRPADIVRAQGFPVNEELWGELEGNTLGTMARSIGLHVNEFTGAFERLNPNIVLVIGDRYEALAAGLAAVYTNRTLCHLQGGETSGSIDESARHCLTKLAQYHVPATEQAKDNIIRMGERPETVIAVGCPSADLAARVQVTKSAKRFLLVVYHPNTTEYGRAAAEMREVLIAVQRTNEHAIVLWPNVDAGSDSISKSIRQFRDLHSPAWEYLTNVEPEEYLKLLATTACACGNSSSFVRDAGFFGTPVVLVGNRQAGRQCGENVERVECDGIGIREAIELQLLRGRYFPNDLYGKPGISQRIAARLATIALYVQKRSSFQEVEALCVQS